MNWNSGYSSLFELKKVDPVSWLDAGSFDFTSGSINRTNSGLLESADLSMTENPGECWIRIYLKARQEGGSDRIALFTGLTSTPSRDIDGTRTSYPVEVYSVLKPVADVFVPLGYYAPAGASAGALVADLLKVGAAPVVVDAESPVLIDAVVSEDDMSRLDMAWLILNAVGWRLRITGDGVVHIAPAADQVSAVFDTEDNDVIENSITDSQDWFSVPNCIRVISGEQHIEFKNEDPDDLTSTETRKKNRGGSGEIWMSDKSPTTGSNESLAEYSIRKLSEAQAPARKISYTRRYRPNVLPGDIVGLHFPVIGIDDTFKVESQTVELAYGCRTKEEVTYERI